MTKTPIGKFFEEMGWDLAPKDVMSQELATIEDKLSLLYKQVDELKSRKKFLIGHIVEVRCEHCKELVPIAECVLLKHEHYVAPYSCSGGDYWQLNDNRSIRCRCGNQGLINSSTIGTGALEIYAPSFSSVEYYKEK